MILDSTILLHRDELTRKEWRKLFLALTFADNDNNMIEVYDHIESRHAVRIPRGALDLLPRRLEVKDMRTCPPMPKLHFTRELDGAEFEGQRDALAAMFEHEQGQVIRPPGTGKTNIALAFAAMCKTRTLVLVHTKRLFDQWVAEVELAIPGADVGKIRGSECTVGHVTIAMVQTLKRYVRKGRVFWKQWGCLIVDEEHHAGAETWEWLLNVCPAKYRFGLTATEKRADGRHPLIRLLIGKVIHTSKFKSPYPIKVVPVGTGFKSSYSPLHYSRMLRQLCADPKRNKIIAEIALNEMANGNSVVVLSEQIKHLEHIYGIMQTMLLANEVALLTGRVNNKKQLQIMEDFKAKRVNCVLATRIFDEGLDVPVINRVILTFPGKHETPIIQRIGRALRKHELKEDVIVYDIVDDRVPKFVEHYSKRREVYRRMDIKIGKAVQHGEKERNRPWLGRRGLDPEEGRLISDRFKVRRGTRA